VRDLRGIWIGQYDRKSTNIQTIPEEIAAQVCGKLGVQLTADEQKRLTKRNTHDPEAYQLYLKGRFYWEKRNEEGFKRAIAYFKQALEKDRNCALAWVGLADSYYLLADYNWQPAEEMLGKAKDAAGRAVELDGTLADAHASLAAVRFSHDWDVPG